MRNPRLNHSGIYGFFNVLNGNCYVGSAVNLRKRITGHLECLRKGNHQNQHFQRAWHKYGSVNFSWVILEFVDNPDFLLEREQDWIDSMDSRYNIHRIAGSARGHVPSKETREKLGQATKRRWQCQEYREKMSDMAKSLKQSDEVKKKLSDIAKKQWQDSEKREQMIASMTKKLNDPETRKRISEGQRGLKKSPEARAKMAASKKAKWTDPEYRARMVAAHIGRKQTPEQCAKKSASLKIAWARRKKLAQEKKDET